MRPRAPAVRLAVIAVLTAAVACAQPRGGEPGSDALPQPSGDTAPAPDAARTPDAGPAKVDGPTPPSDARTVSDVGGPDAPTPAPDAPGARDTLTGAGKLGEVCSATDDCRSGFCVHGVCCENSWAGACRFCNVPDRGGTCVDSMGPSVARGCNVEGEICLAANRCLGPDQSCLVFASHETAGGAAIAQTFVAGRTGQLVAVRLGVTCYANQEITLEMHTATNVDPEGQLLSTQAVRGPASPDDSFDEPRLIPLVTPIPVRSGDQLSMVIRFQGPPSCTVRLSNSSCNPGRFYQQAGTPPAWAIDNNSDASFRTYIVE
jgi:hypothetical protein